MNKPYTIIHMYISIDGKIDGAYMEQEGCDISGKYYDDVIFQMGTSMASGRTTAEMYHAKGQIDYSKYDTSSIDYSDNYISYPHYHFVFDRYGKCNWDKRFLTYGGIQMMNVPVLSPSVRKEYLAYLKSMDIPYIIAKDLNEAMNKIYSLFKVKRLVCTGGATINGGLLAANLADEISLVVAPYIEGNSSFKQFVDNIETFNSTKFIFKEAKPLDDGGVQLTFLKHI